jgi:hypothetical protein
LDQKTPQAARKTIRIPGGAVAFQVRTRCSPYKEHFLFFYLISFRINHGSKNYMRSQSPFLKLMIFLNLTLGNILDPSIESPIFFFNPITPVFFGQPGGENRKPTNSAESFLLVGS